MRYFSALLSLALAACVTPNTGGSSQGAQALQTAIIAEEVAFMAATRSDGLMPAFAQRADDDAIMFLPEPVRIADRLATENWAGVVSWAPAFVATAGDGSMGLSTGPSSWVAGSTVYPGYYITVWERQQDGSLRFVFDSSADLPTDLYADRSTQIERLAGHGKASFDAGSDASLAAALAQADTAAPLPYHPRARILRDGQPPVIGASQASALLEAGERRSTLARTVAPSGDFAWTYGRILSRGSERPNAHFAQVWLNEGNGWRVIIDFRKAMPEQ